MELEYGPYCEGIDPISARKIIEIVGRQGNPPEYGFQYFTAGLDNYFRTIDEDYLGSFVKEAFLSLTERHDDDFTLIIQWLKGESPPKNLLKDFKIFER